MNFWFFLFSLAIQFSYCTPNDDADLKHTLDSYPKRDPSCTFNYTEVNSKTIEFFPSCKKVYGIVVINENTNLLPGKLRPYFRNLKKLYGGIRIENTTFTSISIFPANSDISVYCDYYGVFILNNNELYDGSMFSDISFVASDKNDLCNIQVENNKELNMEGFCNEDYFERLMGMRTKGNYRNCGCQGDQIALTNLPTYEDCKTLYNGLKLTNITDISSLSALSKVKVIYGNIDIQNSSIKDMSFLKNLKMWNVRSSKNVIFNLQNNPEMTRLPFDFFGELENILYDGIKILNFENLHPDFCLTIEEIWHMFNYELSSLKFHAKLCEEIGDLEENVLCRFETMDDLPNNCNIILGDLVIENGDEDIMTKLMNVELIVGSIIIRNTELKNFKYLGLVLCIIQLDDSKPVIQIVGNKQLKDPTISEITNIITRENRVAIIQDNSPNMFKSNVCALVTEFHGYLQRKYRVRLDYTGGDCDQKCTFNYTEVTSKTIKYFPTCSLVYGIIVINNNTDVSATKLETAFRNMASLAGGIKIENSTLKDLSIFQFRWFLFYCETYGFYLLNNSKLTGIGSVPQMNFIPDKNFNECTVRIENNKKLNMEETCIEESLGQLMNVKINGNLKDCGCDGAQFTSTSVNQFESCNSIFNGLSLSNITEPLNLSSLSNLYVIKGPLIVQNTNLQNLSFFENLHYLRINTNDGIMLNLKDNLQMTRLAFSNITTTFKNTNTSGLRNFNFENLHPDFCLTRTEFQLFSENSVTLVNFHGKLCEETEKYDSLCYFESMKELPNNCLTIIGDLVIGSGDEEHVSKLLQLFHLYGSIEVRNTKLEDLKFLYSIMLIVFLNDSKPVIQIIGNKNLTSPYFGIVNNIYTRGRRDAIIQDNHPDIFNKTDGTCDMFGSAPADMMYRRRLNYTGGDCGTYVDLTSNLRRSPETNFIYLIMSAVMLNRLGFI